MLWMIGVTVLVLWTLGIATAPVAGASIHVLLVIPLFIAVVSLVGRGDRRSTRRRYPPRAQ